MKKLINFFKKGFEDLNYTYYEHLYFYNGRHYVGYIVVQNYRFFWLPMHRRIAVCCDQEDLNFILNFYRGT